MWAGASAGGPSSLPIVNVPPGTNTIVAPSRFPTIARGQPELWTPASLLAENPSGSVRVTVGILGPPTGAGVMASGDGWDFVSSAGLAGSVRVALPWVGLGWTTTTWGGAALVRAPVEPGSRP